MSEQYRKVKVTLVRSPIGYRVDQRETAKALGLRKIRSSAIHTETPQIAGMLHKIRHLLVVEEVIEESK
ncbi:MAG: 50S ribosomal protein L30 [Chitinophagaceae bacterium]|nr:50S ribosomal protein L30 [Anaerolineae bacterium]